MTDSEVYADDAAGPLDRLEDGSYDDDSMGDVVSSDAFEQTPEWFQERMSRFSRKNRNLRDENDELRQRVNAIETNIAQNPQDSQPEEEKTGWGRFTTDDLEGWVTRSQELMVAASRDPENEEVRAEVAKIKPDHLMSVQRELTKRLARDEVKGLRDEIDGRQHETERSAVVQRKIVQDFGPSALDPGSKLFKAAAKQFETIVTDNGGSFPMAEYYAFQAAYDETSENSRAGGRDLKSVRRLEIEGQGARSAQSSANVSALKKAGRFEEAFSKELDSWLDTNDLS